MGQQVIWAENFNYHYQQNFGYPWATEGNSASFPWSCDEDYLIGTLCFPYTGNHTRVAGVGDFRLPPGSLCGQLDQNDSNVLLKSPIIPFSSVQNAFFSYDSYFEGKTNGGKTESATIEVSTDSGRTWTVLQRPPLCTGEHMETGYVSLAAYNNVPSIRLGFRYSDSGRKMVGWMMDNMKIFIPAANDLKLVRANPEEPLLSYMLVNSSAQISGTVMNYGTNPVTAFSVQYQEGSGPVQTYNVSGVNIAAFDTLDFVHSVPLLISTIGKHDIKVWVTLAGDANHNNDSVNTRLNGVQFMPQKKVAIEEGTGTWHMYGPRGNVYMHTIANNDFPPSLISVHAGDPMAVTAYKDYLYYLNQNFITYFLFDRRGQVRYPKFFSEYERQKYFFGFADINLRGVSTSGNVAVNADIKPAINLSGDYRIAVVLTEDDVTGTDTNYDQENVYAGGGQGPMGGFESLPNPVPAASMDYDYVARSISPDPGGKIGCLPSTMLAGNTYSCAVSIPLNAQWKKPKLKVVALLINGTDSTILNSKTVKLSALGVENTAGNASMLQVYPNPAGGSATVAFSTAERRLINITATDITGRSVYQYPAGYLGSGTHRIPVDVTRWPSGMYFITLEAGEQRETVKLSVVH